MIRYFHSSAVDSESAEQACERLAFYPILNRFEQTKLNICPGIPRGAWILDLLPAVRPISPHDINSEHG